MLYGYARISKPTQKIERQVENILKAFSDAVIVKEAYTGTKIDRPEFSKLLKKVSLGDTIIFDSVSRMSRNAEEGFELYERLFNQGVNLVFLKEPHINTETYKSAMDNQVALTGGMVDAIIKGINEYLMLLAKEQIRIAFNQAQKEVDDLHHRTSEGLREAKRKGKRVGCSVGDRLTTKKSIEAKKQILKYNKTFGGPLNNEDTWTLIGITKPTFYKYKNELLEDR